MADSLPAPVRAIRTEHDRSYCGYDTLYVTPADEEGYQYIHVFKLFPSRLVGLYPSKDLTSDSLALAMFQFFVTYGLTDVLITDPGSNITSEVIEKLLAWFGVRLRLSIVARHESNGVERTNREVLRFLQLLVHSERLIKIWSRPHVICAVQFLLNEQVNSETGISPFEFVFGSDDVRYFSLPEGDDLKVRAGSFLQLLNRNLSAIRSEARKIQSVEQEKRLIGGGETVNAYQPGDYVLRKVTKMMDKVAKLTPNYLGPYVVLSVDKADVTCRHLVTDVVSVFHMDALKICFASPEDAFQAALVDYNQYVIKEFLQYRGDPELRTSMSFRVRFEDGEVIWLPYSKELAETVQFEQFVRENRPLLPLLYTLKVWERIKKADHNIVKEVSLGETCYVDLRAWGSAYFESLNLPEDGSTYVVECKYLSWENKRRSKVCLTCQLFGQKFTWNSFSVYAYGMQKVVGAKMVLVDEEFCRSFGIDC